MLNQAVISHPPQIPNLNVKHGVRMRFICGSPFAGNITFQNLLDIWLLAATAIAGYDIFRFVKIRRVHAWAAAVVGNATTVTVGFTGLTAGATGDGNIHTDTSMGIQPAYVSAKPNQRTLAADYQPNSTANAFELLCPAGAVIDVELSYKQLLGTAVSAQNALVGATVGAMYVRGLDGLAIAGTKFVPVADATI
jgi:hypothetical protein